MLTIPPALAMKSGAQRISRAWSMSAIASSASWLLAAPATPRPLPGGGSAGPAAPARQPGDVRGLLADERDVARARPDVLGRHVAPAERVDGVAEVTQRVAAARGGDLAAGREHDHALA